MPCRHLRVLLAAALLLLPRLAAAHAILEESTPAAGAVLHPGPVDVTLRYNSRIDRDRSRLTLISSGHAQEPVSIAPDPRPDILACHLTLAEGAYTIRWQVLAVDGHITRGDVPFTVGGN